MRKKIVAGNWKMNLDLNPGKSLATAVKDHISKKGSMKAEIVLCTPFIHLASLEQILKGSSISFGAQNCSSEPSGAYTGEISCGMIKSTGAWWVIIGHSERRSYFSEDDALLNRKTRLAIKEGLKVIFCCGELLPERESSKHFDVVRKQLEDGLFNLSKKEIKEVTLAYEPVWAIGTGLTATPGQAQEMHKFIRNLISKKFGTTIASEISILYGGSCKPSNAAEIFSMPDVDGGLIGGASLKSDDFCAIAEAIS